jgi:hypothetical protein
VSSVDVVERAPGRYALVEVLVEHIGANEQEALLRVWRPRHNAFGFKGAGLAGA